MNASPERRQIAERMQELLIRQIGHSIDLVELLENPLYARDVLLVCDACSGSELMSLSARFRSAGLPTSPNLPKASTPAAKPSPTPPVALRAPGHAQQPNDWSRDTSGFGISQPPPVPGQRRDAAPADAPPTERRRSWLSAWRRR